VREFVFFLEGGKEGEMRFQEKIGLFEMKEVLKGREGSFEGKGRECA
jgi:hypothetical protein